MAMPTVNQLKGMLRVETTTEDTFLTEALAQANGTVRRLLDRPIEAVEKTYRIERDSLSSRAITKLLIPDTPVKLASPDAPVIEDSEGDAVDDTTYMVDGETGVVRALDGYDFCLFPYEITATVGLAVASDYATVTEPMLRMAILAYAAMLYHQRNPNASQESTAGVTVTYLGVSMPPRTAETLMALRRAL